MAKLPFQEVFNDKLNSATAQGPFYTFIKDTSNQMAKME